jgi:hypothetical protein
MTDSLEQELLKPSTLVPIYSLENRILLNSSDEVVQAARSAIQEIVESYRRPTMTEEDIRRGAYLDIKDPVKEFGEACRKELKHLYRVATYVQPQNDNYDGPRTRLGLPLPFDCRDLSREADGGEPPAWHKDLFGGNKEKS